MLDVTDNVRYGILFQRDILFNKYILKKQVEICDC